MRACLRTCLGARVYVRSHPRRRAQTREQTRTARSLVACAVSVFEYSSHECVRRRPRSTAAAGDCGSAGRAIACSSCSARSWYQRARALSALLGWVQCSRASRDRAQFSNAAALFGARGETFPSAKPKSVARDCGPQNVRAQSVAPSAMSELPDAKSVAGRRPCHLVAISREFCALDLALTGGCGARF